MAAEASYGSKAWRDQKAAAQRRLDECLRVMADHEFENQNEIISCAGVLAKVYADKEFRHRYSSIVEVIEGFNHPVISESEARERIAQFNSEIQQEQVRASVLAANLRVFIVYDHDGASAIENDEDILILQRDRTLEKLYDHVNLEAKCSGANSGRMKMLVDEVGQANKSLVQSNEELAKTEDALKSAKGALKSAKNAAIKAENKAKRMQTELIGILGVFSAVTLAFNAGISFTTSSIGATSSNTSIFQIAFIVSVVGFFLFNTLYAAFSFIYRLVHGPSKGGEQFCQTIVVVICEASSILLMVLFGFLSYWCCCPTTVSVMIS